MSYYIIPSDNWEQQQLELSEAQELYYIIPSDNWEQQLEQRRGWLILNYIIPSDNWEQQQYHLSMPVFPIISYQAITGNNNQL